jgi:gas vesicle protein
MSTDPEQIRSDIEATRGELSRDIDTLGYRVTPAGMARHQTEQVKSGLKRLRERVMGSAESGSTSARHAVSSMGETVQGAAESTREAVAEAPRAVLRQAEGNPLAAGLVAFGLGLVVASLIPASEKETEMAQRVKEAAEPLMDDVKEMAGTVASDLREPAQEELRQMGESVKEAGGDLADQGRAAASEVAEHGKEAASDVRDRASGGAS